jgi:hypothetical protein
MFCLRAFQKLAKQTHAETHTQTHTQRQRQRQRKRKEKKEQGEEQKRNLAKCRRIRKQEPGKKAQKKKEKDRRSTKDFKLGTFVANLCSGHRIEKTQILRSLQNHCSDGGTSSNGRRECACNGLQEEETQEEGSAASQRAIAWLAKPP